MKKTLSKISEVELLTLEYGNTIFEIRQLLDKYIMKTKDKIVERLLEQKHINAEEAVTLLKENASSGFKQFTPNITYPDGKVPYHTICGCSVCNCIMAEKMVDPNNSGNFTLDTTFTASNNTTNE